MKKVTLVIALLLVSLPLAAQPAPKTAQSIMQSLGADWQAMSVSQNHVASALGDLQTLAQGLEAKVTQVTTERDALKKELDELKKSKK